jgi:hypothetical protein
MKGQNIKYPYLGDKMLKIISSKPCKKIPSVILEKLGGGGSGPPDFYIAPPLTRGS